MLAFIVNGLKQISWIAIGQPIFHIYMNGPGWLGGWKSRSRADICSQITAVNAQFWELNQKECEDIIQREFLSLYSVVQCILYFYIVLTLFHNLCYNFFVIRPLVNAKKLTLDPFVPTLKAS